MTDSILKVYSAKPILPDVSRVLACLYEKDVKFERIDLYPGHHIARDLLTLQASTRSPVTVWEDGHTLLFESRALCRYISEKYADRGSRYLLGKGRLERASVEQWLKLEEQSFDRLSRDLAFHLAFAVEPSDGALLVGGAQKLASVLDAYDQRLGDCEFLAGNEFSLADLSHLPNSHYIAQSDEWGHLFDSRKNVRRWWHAISRRPSWEKVAEILNEVDIERGDQEEDATVSKSTQKEKSNLHILPSKSSGTQFLTSFVPQPKTHKVELFKGSSTSTSELPRQDPTKPQSSEGSKLGEDDGPTSSKSSGATSTKSTPSTDMSARSAQASSTSTSEAPREDFVKPSSPLTPTASQASLAATDALRTDDKLTSSQSTRTSSQSTQSTTEKLQSRQSLSTSTSKTSTPTLSQSPSSPTSTTNQATSPSDDFKQSTKSTTKNLEQTDTSSVSTSEDSKKVLESPSTITFDTTEATSKTIDESTSRKDDKMTSSTSATQITSTTTDASTISTNGRSTTPQAQNTVTNSQSNSLPSTKGSPSESQSSPTNLADKTNVTDTTSITSQGSTTPSTDTTPSKAQQNSTTEHSKQQEERAQAKIPPTDSPNESSN